MKNSSDRYLRAHEREALRRAVASSGAAAIVDASGTSRSALLNLVCGARANRSTVEMVRRFLEKDEMKLGLK